MELQSEKSLSRAICLLSLEIQIVLDRMLKPYNVTMEQLYLLKILSQGDMELTQREICQKTSKTPANITRFIDRLEKKLFVTRQSTPKDRRACVVVLTGKGQCLLQEVDAVLSRFASRFSSGIDMEDRERMSRGVDALMANVVNMSQELKNRG